MNAFIANVISIKLFVCSNISNVLPKIATIKSKTIDKHTPTIVIVTDCTGVLILDGIIVVNIVQNTISNIHNNRITNVFI